MNHSLAGLQWIRWFVQLASLGFAAIYTYGTVPLYSDNQIWFWLSATLLVFAMIRRPFEAFAAALIILLGYGGFAIYRLYEADWSLSFGWNDLIWLAVFPYMSAVGSIGRLAEASGLAAERASLYEELQGDGAANELEPNTVDSQHGFLGGTAFAFLLEEEVLRTLRERARFRLLLVEIEQFRIYRRMFGYDQSQLLLNQTAAFIGDLPEPPLAKAHLGEGRLAVLMPEQPAEVSDEDMLALVKERLSDEFFAMLVMRPRREAALKIRLRFGTAECPADGIEAKTLLEKAQAELEWNEVS
ncbi:hypothetical protein ACFSR7_18690 [Cohnella sp. GCM10020058]|uniref:hypothetical protein n=1 Tax=Cohnella sp. GCM10020058 TaxID=3317330 RepID=UPI003630EB82